MIYLDNGATSFPKPPEVAKAIAEALTDYCANPGIYTTEKEIDAAASAIKEIAARKR